MPLPPRSDFITSKHFDDEFGWDLQTPALDINRNPTRAVDCGNFTRNPRGGIIARPGSQIKATTLGGLGLFQYNYEDTASASQSKLLTVDKNLHTIDTGTFSIAYAGTAVNTYVRIYVSSSKIYCEIVENGTQAINTDLGKGHNETTIVDMASLKTTIDAISGGNFTVTITGTTTIPAAFLDKTPITSFTSGSATVAINFYYPTQVATPVADPLLTFFNGRNGASFENARFVNHKNCLYVALGSTEGSLYKYDSKDFYKAGLAAPASIISITRSAGGNISGATRWFYTYIYTDAVGNEVESAVSTTSTAVTLTSENADLRLFTTVATSGYNAKGAVAIGNQTVAVSGGTVTLAVDNGVGGAHTLVAGDKAYLYNRSTSAYTTYTVSSVTALTVVLTSTETIQVNDNDVISNNFRIALYRNQTGGSAYYLVAELPNNPFQDTLVYTDSTATVSGNALWEDPDKTQSAPPTCAYVESYNGALVLARGNKIYFSDLGNPSSSAEVFPADDNQETLFGTTGGKITALKKSGAVLCVFGENWIRGIEGDISAGTYQEFEISNSVGCVSASSVAERGSSLVFLSNKGVRVLTNGVLEETSLSYDIDPYFEEPRITAEDTLGLKRSVGVYWPTKDLYTLFIPKETTSVDRYSNKFSDTLAYDFQKKRWFKWNSLDLTGGAVWHGSEMWFHDRSLITSRKLWKFSPETSSVQYYDHVDGIKCWYRSGWEALGEPDVPKKARWIKPYIYTPNPHSYLTNLTNTAIMIKTYIDFMDTWEHTSYSVTREGAGRKWGTAWGQKWGSLVEICPKVKLKSGKVRALQAYFEITTAGEPVILTGWTVIWAPVYNIQVGE